MMIDFDSMVFQDMETQVAPEEEKAPSRLINGRYEIIKRLSYGNEHRKLVFLVKDHEQTDNQVVLKLFTAEEMRGGCLEINCNILLDDSPRVVRMEECC